jgi:putative ABC transport system permease protein
MDEPFKVGTFSLRLVRFKFFKALPFWSSLAFSMVSIARKNLFEDLPRFVVAQAGIMFAVGLVTIQTGLLNGFTRSSSLIIDNAKADIWVGSKDLQQLDLTLPIPYERLTQAQQVQGVERAEALLARGAIWQRSASDPIAPIRLLGFDPDGELFGPWALTTGQASDLKQPYTISVDRSDLGTLKVFRPGDIGAIGTYETTVVAVTQGIRSIVSSPYAFTSLESANTLLMPPNIFPDGRPPETPPALTPKDQVSFILVRARPGEDLQALKLRLEEALPDTKAFTQVEMSDRTRAYWQRSTGVGFILGMGAVVGVVVGMVVVGQILYASVSDHIKEFGTLKAMGSSDWYIYRIIIEQALWMAVLGYLPGLGICLGVGAYTMQARAIQILIGPGTALAVFGLTSVMCTGAAMFAIRKVTHLDPAMVFKS